MTEPEVFYLIQRKSDSMYVEIARFGDSDSGYITDSYSTPDWTKYKSDALVFYEEKYAKLFVSRHNLQDVEIVAFVSIPLSEYKQLKK